MRRFRVKNLRWIRLVSPASRTKVSLTEDTVTRAMNSKNTKQKFGIHVLLLGCSSSSRQHTAHTHPAQQQERPHSRHASSSSSEPLCELTWLT